MIRLFARIYTQTNYDPSLVYFACKWSGFGPEYGLKGLRSLILAIFKSEPCFHV